MPSREAPLPWFVRGDLDGFFGLLIDNLVQLILIVSLCTGLLGMPPGLVFGRILPGVALGYLLMAFLLGVVGGWVSRQEGGGLRF